MTEAAGPQFENKEGIDHNARKFTVGTIDTNFLTQHSTSSYVLITDWLVTDAKSETKLVHKKLANGEIQYFLISKITQNSTRKTDKRQISEDEYKKRLVSSVVHVEKSRYEFNFLQNGIAFTMKYDEFPNSDGRVLEVDGASETERNKFSPNGFPYRLVEVTGDLRYYGYRVAKVLTAFQEN